jgi:hypothetical protein
LGQRLDLAGNALTAPTWNTGVLLNKHDDFVVLEIFDVIPSMVWIVVYVLVFEIAVMKDCICSDGVGPVI